MKEKVAIVSTLANVFLAGSKIFIGIVSHSSAVLAEGFHSLTDIFSSLIGYFGIKVSQKPVDQRHPYGHYKVEVLSGTIITLLLMATGLKVIYEAYQNLLNPEEIKIDSLVFLIMFLSVLINLATSKLKIHYGKKENSLTLLSDGSHDQADAFASAAVLLGLFLTRYWIYADSLLAFLIGVYIIKKSFSLGREAIDCLLDVSAGTEIEEEIRTIAQKENIEINSLKTQKKGSVIAADLEIKLPNNLKVEEATKISDLLREKLVENIKNLSFVAIQIASHEVSTGFYRPALGGLVRRSLGVSGEFGWQKKGKFKGEIDQASGKGLGGDCVCPKCGYKIPHQRGAPCSTFQCPNCKINLERQ